MMNDDKRVHILASELILILDELEQETKEVVLEHMQECSQCRDVYNDSLKVEDYPTLKPSEETEIKPLKKLVQFNRSLKWLFISIRALLLFYIIYSSIHFYNWEIAADAAIEYVKSVTFMFYFPAAVFLIVFTMTFFNKRWIAFSILFDLGVILFLDTFMSIFI